MKILKEYDYKGYDIEYPTHGGAYGVTVARGGRVVREFADEHDAEEWIDEEVGDNESLNEDTVKTSNGKWTNKGKEGTHGKFKTKKQADAQRKAMFANGYKAESKETDKLYNESLGDDLDKLEQDLDSMQIGDSVTVKNYKNGDIYKFVKRGDNDTITDFENVLGKNHLASKQHVLGWAKDSLIYAKYPPKFEFNESSKLDIIKSNRKAYQDVENYIKKVKDPLEKDVYQHLILKWLSNNNWIGGMSDSAFQKQYEKYLSNYSEDEVMDKYDELIGKFDSNNNFIEQGESLKEYLVGGIAGPQKMDYIRKVCDAMHWACCNYIDSKVAEDAYACRWREHVPFWKQFKWTKENREEKAKELLAQIEQKSGVKCSFDPQYAYLIIPFAPEDYSYTDEVTQKAWDKRYGVKESLTEDLSPEEVGASSVFNDLIQKEYDLLSQYDSVQITLEDNGDSRFSDIFEYIKDDINIHIGMLQSCLEDLNGSEEQNSEGEQKADQLLNLDESLFD